MSRQSISFTDPNASWLQSQVDSKEYASKSEVVNDLIRQARKQEETTNYIRKRLMDAEQRGFTNEKRRKFF